MDPVRAIGVRLVSSLDCWCFRDPINGGSQWGIVRSVGTDRVSGGIVWGHSTDDGTLLGPRYLQDPAILECAENRGVLILYPRERHELSRSTIPAQAVRISLESLRWLLNSSASSRRGRCSKRACRVSGAELDSSKGNSSRRLCSSRSMQRQRHSGHFLLPLQWL